MARRADQAEVADYIQTLLLELRLLSRRADLQFLTYALEIALIEASDIASGKAPTAFLERDAASASPAVAPEELVRRVLSVERSQ